MSAPHSIPDTDFCAECGMDWHQPHPAGYHYPECSRYAAAAPIPVPDDEDTPWPPEEADDDLPC